MSIFVEKYRPRTVAECILPDDIKSIFQGFVDSKEIPTMLLTGGAGCGKTTIARALCNEVGADVLFINASLDANLDAIRNNIAKFASTVSFSDSKKITILDEADGLTQLQQQALRGFIEEFSGNHSIIFTANFANKIIDPLKSRCKCIDFKIRKSDKPVIASQMLKRIMQILKAEEIEFDKESVAALVMKKFPDFRATINELQGYSAGGKIDAGILLSLNETAINELLVALKSKKFNDCRKWVAEHSDLESEAFYRLFYDNMDSKLEQKSIPELILLLGDYSYKDSFCLDKEIIRTAFITAMMTNPSVKWL